jgi:hypothetical protein
LTVNCDQAASVTLTGQLTERVGKKPRHRKTFRLGPIRASVEVGAATPLSVKLPQPPLNGLRKAGKAQVLFTATASNANGATPVLTKATTAQAGFLTCRRAGGSDSIRSPARARGPTSRRWRGKRQPQAWVVARRSSGRTGLQWPVR